MLSFFRRKKPQDAPQDAPKTQHYTAEELAAAFPQADHAPVAEDTSAPVGRAEPGATPVARADAAVAPAASPHVVSEAPAVPAAPLAAPPSTAVPVPPSASIPSPPSPVEPGSARLLADPAPVLVTTEIVQEAAQPLASPAAIDEAAPAAPGKTGWRDRLRNSVIARSFGGLFSRNPKLDDDLLDELETALITADVGVGATTALVENLRKRMKAREFADAPALLKALRAELIAILQPVAKPLVIDRTAKPFVILTVGVNGVGKTTTIGKLAKRFKDDGHSLMLAAGDTFRAAAVAQLQAWGERNGVAVVAQGQNADAASVAFDALQAGKARGTDVLIADTAGRLHTQGGLMNELGKIRRVLGKIDPNAPHEVLMVIDGTTGQNALSQLRQFHAAVNVTGLVVTKLDGTAKGGVVFALAREFGIPIRFAGIGERPEDLRVFDPEAFVDALLPEALGG
ncbi:signal recognition particle-docking protein FtsY [Stenotrophomonas sp. VV52]|uniref:signal recognition particle-docking protein FtsY n=1 Tax=Stenotrophomonas sp. VV52 TaxID=2066958 RepID=UPI000C9E8ACC|nr:signal recognition particle-docking protein FtsY [Stenotrophomonas sp. VV52]